MPIGGQHGERYRNRVKWTLFLIGQFAIGIVWLSLMLALGLSWLYLALLFLISIPIAIIWGSIPTLWIYDWVTRREMETYCAKSFELYESKLPE